MKLVYGLWVLIITIAFAGCDTDPLIKSGGGSEVLSIPAGFPEPDFPEDNAFTSDRYALGRRLFYDPILSVDSSISCATCHKPQLAFSDNRSTTPGVFDRPGKRNAPTLTNVAYHPYLTREGGVSSLEKQVLVPIQEHNEFGFNILSIADRLMDDQEYVDMSWKAYNRDPDYFVIVRAIATFERSLISGNSPYDKYRFQGKVGALSPDELAGMDLFFSERTNCSKCHSGFNFTNYGFENNGLYQTYEDPGRYRLTKQDHDLARFKVPTLRNVAETAPYMHDGSLGSLREVVDHYVSGGAKHQNKSSLIRPLDLQEREKQQLVRFLESLSDHDFINNLQFRE